MLLLPKMERLFAFVKVFFGLWEIVFEQERAWGFVVWTGLGVRLDWFALLQAVGGARLLGCVFGNAR